LLKDRPSQDGKKRGNRARLAKAGVFKASAVKAIIAE
jgi:hypothetical protein